MGRAGVHYLAHTIICSDLMIKGIILEVQELLLDVLVVAVHPSMLWGCSSASAWGGGGGEGRCSLCFSAVELQLACLSMYKG